MAIALVGDPSDLCATYIRWLAERRDIQVYALDEARLGIDWHFGIEEVRGDSELVCQGRSLPTHDVTGAFVRFNPRPETPTFATLTSAQRAVFIRERRSAIIALLETVPWVVVNRPLAGRDNASKPYQMRRLAESGLRVPNWIAVSDRKRTEEFLASCSTGCVYKACSGLRSHVRIADGALLSRLDHPTCAALVQRYIPGFDVRIHVVGNRVMACKVASDALDYRFDEAETKYTSAIAPPELIHRCVEFSRANGLLLAGFDFRVDDTGDWWCLEVNPVPTFLPYEAGTGAAIGDAVLDLIAPGSIRRNEASVLSSEL